MGLLSTVQYKILLKCYLRWLLGFRGRFLAPKFVLSVVRYSVEPEFIHSNSFGPLAVFPYSE